MCLPGLLLGDWNGEQSQEPALYGHWNQRPIRLFSPQSGLSISHSVEGRYLSRTVISHDYPLTVEHHFKL